MEGRKPADFESTGRRFSLLKFQVMSNSYMHVNFWLKRLLCRFRKTEQKETSSGGKMNNKSSG